MGIEYFVFAVGCSSIVWLLLDYRIGLIKKNYEKSLREGIDIVESTVKRDCFIKVKDYYDQYSRLLDDESRTLKKIVEYTKDLVSETDKQIQEFGAKIKVAQDLSDRALSLAMDAKIEVEAMKRTTHRVEYIPVDKLTTSQPDSNGVEATRESMKRFNDMVDQANNAEIPQDYGDI